jgi:hypothetical protein
MCPNHIDFPFLLAKYGGEVGKLFTRSTQGAKQGQMQDLIKSEDPILAQPAWVEEIKQEIRAMGDLMRLREALAVAYRDIERLRMDRDKLIRYLKQEKDKVVELEEVVKRQMRK